MYSGRSAAAMASQFMLGHTLRQQIGRKGNRVESWRDPETEEH